MAPDEAPSKVGKPDNLIQTSPIHSGSNKCSSHCASAIHRATLESRVLSGVGDLSKETSLIRRSSVIKRLPELASGLGISLLSRHPIPAVV
jgi:hypothetical protein